MGRSKADNKSTTLFKCAVCFLLAWAMISSLFTSMAPQTARASQPAGDVIFNYPYVPPPVTRPISPRDIDWNYSANHSRYDQAYTQALSQQYNGTATPDHVVLSDDPVTAGTISFFGHGEQPAMDYLLTSTSVDSFQGLSFVMHPVNMNFHTLSETGFLFNGAMSAEEGGVYYTGYAVILSCANDFGMQEGDKTAPDTAALRVYYIDHELWDTEYFRPGNTYNTRTLIATIKTGINDLDSTPYRVSVEIDPANRAFEVFVDGQRFVSLDGPEVKGGASGSTGFGFYTGYYSHDCAILTRIRYENCSIITASDSADDPTDANCQVKFLEKNTDQEIRLPETETGSVGQKYRIVQPHKIVFHGDTYYLVSNSRNASTQSDLKLSYLSGSAENVTTLFYLNLSGDSLQSQELLAQAPEKNARVNGGEWSCGTTETPVLVTAGSQIEYRVTAYSPPAVIGRPMMMQGSASQYADATWWNQSAGTTPAGSTVTSIQKFQIETVAFVDLPEAFDPAAGVVAQFLATYPSWNGKQVLRAWDATDTTSANPDQNIQRVVAWVTGSAVSGRYDLYVGGRGGVWMSASPAASNLFNNFVYVSAIDLSDFHTDQATNMSGMFYAFAYYGAVPLTMDLTRFDTSRVTTMNSMFYQFAYSAKTLPNLDLTHFNTSRVTDMSNMFWCCAYNATDPVPTTLDLTHFDTSRVTNMSGMFLYYGYSSTVPVTLDLTRFDTSQVTNMSDMFSYCSYRATEPATIDLTHFDTSRVTNMANMFRYFAYSSTAPPVLDLTHFDTSQVTDMSCMFQYYAYSATSEPVLDLSRIDTTKAKTMSGMFSGYAYHLTTPYTLDLRWFKIGAATGGTDITQMFLSCPQLTELHLESGVFRASPLTIPASSNMFYGANANLNVYVGTAADQSWMQGRSPAPSRVTVQAPEGSQPAPRAVTQIPPLAPLPVHSSAEPITIIDTVPDGLSIDESSITGTCRATPTGDSVTWQRDGQTIIWSVPCDLLPADVSVTVTVLTSLAPDTCFVNTATAGAQATNATHHKLRAGWIVTERYVSSDTGAKLDDDLTTVVDPGGAYHVQGATTTLAGSAYVGYQRVGIDSAVQSEPPPAPAYDVSTHGADFAATNHETMILYYKRTSATVTIHFVDEAGSELVSPVVAGAILDQDYYLQHSFFGALEIGGVVYTYFNYGAQGDGSVKDQGLPAPALSPGASPVFPDGSAPTFSAAQMTGDKEVTLYFTNQKAVTMRYVEKGNPAHLLRPDATYFAAASFDTDPAVISSLTDSATSKAYHYSSQYSLDRGATIVTGTPGVVDAAADVTLYYSTSYTITEKYHAAFDATTETTPTVLAPDRSTQVASAEAFFSTGPPARINGYQYVGYTQGNDSNTVEKGYPSSIVPLIAAVFEDQSIIYVYEKYQPKVTYVDWDSSVIATQTVGYGQNATPPADPSRNSYLFTGWDKDGTNITEDTTITALYEYDGPFTGLRGSGSSTAHLALLAVVVVALAVFCLRSVLLKRRCHA